MSDFDYKKQEIAHYTEQAYLDYSMYVLLDRALPHLFDGLKPVQRRIIFAMYELNLDFTAKPKKSARTVGDVIGKYHPHGDSATYESMVLMAQSFSYRYPVIEGQGNWGSPDEPKSFAAMRYTEAKLTHYASGLIRDIDNQTVPWTENFDGSYKEPVYLPARLPNILLNGARGIAVGMTTNCMPHNLNEIVNATIELLKNPECTTQQLLSIVKGPDFPSPCKIILPDDELLRIYESGQGMIRTRCLWELENSTDLVITSLPPVCSAPKCIEQIAHQIENKKLPMVIDIRDESDHEQAIRIVLKLRSNRVDAAAVMQHLFATTELENIHRFHVNVINGQGRPVIMGIKQLLLEWLDFRRDIVIKRTEYRLAQIDQRLESLQALLAAFQQIDAVIKIIREEDKPKPKLMALLKLTDSQVETVLAMRLRQLAKLQQRELGNEADKLKKEQIGLQKLISTRANLDKVIISELQSDAKTFGDERRCEVVTSIEPAKKIILTDPKEPITLVVSKAGWVRCLKEKNVDKSKLSFRSSDALAFILEGYSTDAIILLDNKGKSYTLERSLLPDGRGYGEPVTKWLDISGDHEILSGIIADKSAHSMLITDFGKGMVVPNKNLISKIKSGKQILKMNGAKRLWGMSVVEPDSQICIIDSAGLLLIYPLSQMPIQNSGSGVKAKGLKNPSDKVVAFTIKHPTDNLLIDSGKRTMKLNATKCETFIAKRTSKGNSLSVGYKVVSDIQAEENIKLKKKYIADLAKSIENQGKQTEVNPAEVKPENASVDKHRATKVLHENVTAEAEPKAEPENITDSAVVSSVPMVEPKKDKPIDQSSMFDDLDD